ncbi:uncharacterized protein RHIMIDRAFT_104900 [Rhizopus microsporus ATCC 52813]|uniref:Uncharacterized protein n=1 Tax=Rhizopus microsporus ATCC 52813 TaxID=1340429 RepID=A0A2G4T213_RHIZD|nr:uncharacterized protein RHIMIDRAFT_104900 [Rhizopus microsporus ATCC 52813]PHZ14706.1 hypothetical protein RHIMIDRAFT_104900 [Rhizopus microsporus ATCC 52813]
MQSMVLVILGLKASDNVAFWTCGKKKKEKVSACSLHLAIKRKISTYPNHSLFGYQTTVYLSKNFILLLPHFDFLFFNNKIYLLDVLFFASDNPKETTV